MKVGCLINREENREICKGMNKDEKTDFIPVMQYSNFGYGNHSINF